MKTPILILTLLLVAGLPLEAASKRYRRHTPRHRPAVSVGVYTQFGAGAYSYGRRPARACSAWVPCGHPCAKYNKYKKYRKCMHKQRKKQQKYYRKHPWNRRVPYRPFRPY